MVEPTKPELPTDLAVIQKALDFASRHHANTFRKNFPLPFISHPLDVLKRISRWKISHTDFDTMWVTAILHDTVEDTTATLAEIEREFGYTVMKMVRELTFDPSEGVVKEKYMESFANARVDILLIKIADRICNVYDFLDTDAVYAAKYFDKAHVLWDTLLSRNKDITDAFGKETCFQVLADWGRLYQDVKARPYQRKQ